MRPISPAYRRNSIPADIARRTVWPACDACCRVRPSRPWYFGGTPLLLAEVDWRRSWGGASVAGWRPWVNARLSALAAYAYENPSDPSPEIVADGPCFEAEDLGHPLLPRDRAIRNNIRLSGELCVLVVSGSNMSGKSTFLRTVGINAVLALAGRGARPSLAHLSARRGRYPPGAGLPASRTLAVLCRGATDSPTTRFGQTTAAAAVPSR